MFDTTTTLRCAVCDSLAYIAINVQSGNGPSIMRPLCAAHMPKPQKQATNSELAALRARVAELESQLGAKLIVQSAEALSGDLGDLLIDALTVRVSEATQRAEAAEAEAARLRALADAAVAARAGLYRDPALEMRLTDLAYAERARREGESV